MIHTPLIEPTHKGTAVLLTVAIVALAMFGCCKTQGQRVFKSPDVAVRALAKAAQADQEDELLAIFGPDGKEVLSSGDPVADRGNIEVFAVALEQGWALENVNDRTMELVIGNEKWPFPIPLVKDRYGWRFDTEAGKTEVLARRVGRNELATIAVCRIYLLAQKEYASQGRDGKKPGIYAQKIHSTPGKHDGLYWPATKPGTPASPLSDLAGQAESEGYSAAKGGKPAPFHGYIYRVLTRQGAQSPGGAKNYVANGEMTGGFALMAIPAEYGNSGIMTFLVNQDGVVYEKDLGWDTEKLAPKITEFNPDKSWRDVK